MNIRLSIFILAATCLCPGGTPPATTAPASSLSRTHLAHTLEGQGPLVVFVHGLGGRKGVWKDLAAVLRRDHTVLCLDLPGHGQSGPPVLDEEGAVDLAAAGRAVADLLGELDRGPALLVGHSIGGPIAAEAVRAAPGRVRGLVLVDSFLAPGPGAWIPGFLADLDRDKAKALADFYMPMALGRKQGEQLVREAMGVDTGVLQAYLRALGGLHTFGWVRDLSLPVLALQAGPLPPGREEAADLAQRGLADIPDLQVKRFPRSRHWPMWDEKEAFLRALASFEAGLANP